MGELVTVKEPDLFLAARTHQLLSHPTGTNAPEKQDNAKISANEEAGTAFKTYALA